MRAFLLQLKRGRWQPAVLLKNPFFFFIYFIPFIASTCLDFLVAVVAAACLLVISFGYPSSL